MKSFRNIFFLIIIIAVIFSAFYFFNPNLYAEAKTYIQKSSIKLVEKNRDIVKIHIFYSKDCDSCHRVLEILDKIRMDNPGVELVTYELSEKDNTSILFYLFDSLGVEELDYKIPQSGLIFLQICFAFLIWTQDKNRL